MIAKLQRHETPQGEQALLLARKIPYPIQYPASPQSKTGQPLLRANPFTLNTIFGRGERIRTFDPLVPNQMRYQAALRPDYPAF